MPPAAPDEDERADPGPASWPALRRLLRAFLADRPGFAAELTERIHSEVVYDIPFEEHEQAAAAHLAFLTEYHPDTDAEQIPPRLGAERARQGIPLAASLDTYRVGAAYLWSQFVAYGRGSGHASTDDLVDLASDIWLIHDRFSRLFAAGWNEEHNALSLRSQQERAALVDAIVREGIDPPGRLWEAIDRLGLPRTGGYTVVVVRVQDPSRTPLPELEQRLERARIGSAWALRAEMLVGVVGLPDDAAERTLIEELERTGADCGVGPRSHDYAHGPQAFRFAAAAAAAASGGRVVRFADAPLGVLVAAAPDVADAVAEGVLRGLDDLAADERATLLETLRTWFAHGGSTAATARALFVHPNTVRNRLNRLESLTHRSLSHPLHTAELAVALTATAQR